MSFNPQIIGEATLEDIGDVDSYKAGHPYQFPKGMTRGHWYLEGRNGAHYARMQNFGGQYIVREQFSKRFTAPVIKQAAVLFKNHRDPFPYEGWMRIVDLHKGLLPIRVRAVPEGLVVPINNAILTSESLDPELAWLPGWLETQIERLWYPMCVATRSYYCRQTILESLQRTSDDPEGEISYKLHNFGDRGVTCREQAGIGGASHLVNFNGSDSMLGTIFAMKHYAADPVGVSIPAMEHSTVLAWGKNHEEAAYFNMIEESIKRGFNMLACVSDTYDIDNAVENIWGGSLHQKVKDSGAIVVIRPDSGDPVEVNLKIMRTLERKIGMRKNGKGFKVLPSYYRIIQGDGNEDENSVREILDALEKAGYSGTNIAFGMGGGLVQKVNRDTQRIAFKLSEVLVDGESRHVRKTPKDCEWKASKAGRLDLIHQDGGFKTVVIDGDAEHVMGSTMHTIFENGRMPDKAFTTFADVRKRALGL